MAMNNERQVKQVIVIRKDLKMRRGKEIAQGAHASMAFLVPYVFDGTSLEDCVPAVRQWLEGAFTKVCVRVESEQQLLDVYTAATEAGLLATLIKDAGRTEFKEPTYTAVAVGPDWADVVDAITGELQLY